MTMHARIWYAIPTATAEAARKAFPKGNRYLTLADHLGMLYLDADFATMYPNHGRLAESPARLAMILVLAHLEGLSDVDAAEAVRARLDWKYLLALPLDDPGFDASILVDFRARLLQHGLETRLLTILLKEAQELDLFVARGRQRTDATCAASPDLVSLSQTGRTRREVLELPNSPKRKSVRGQEHVGKAENSRRYDG